MDSRIADAPDAASRLSCSPGSGSTALSVVIPALNAAGELPATLVALRGSGEIVVVDGGSADGTSDVAREHGAVVTDGPRGRGSQLAAGVAHASGNWLLLLHADTRLGPGWRAAVARHICRAPDHAGYFRLAFDTDARVARRLEQVVAWRARRFGLPYGDQGLLISRALLDRLGGVRPLPFLEDVDLVRRIGRARLDALDAVATTSPARYIRDGWYRRSFKNVLCLTLYFLGVPPRRIARLYR